MEAERRHQDIFTAQEAAAYLRVEVSTLDHYRRQKMLTGYQNGKSICYWREDLDDCALRVFGRTPPQRLQPPAMKPMSFRNSWR